MDRFTRGLPRWACPSPDQEASTFEYVLFITTVTVVLVLVLAGIGSIVKDAINHLNRCVTSHGTSTGCPPLPHRAVLPR
jgi:Flp pilus assembly pilin Flp